MSGITSGVGLISGIDITALTQSIINAQRGPVDLLSARREGLTAVQTGLTSLQALVLGVQGAAQSLGESSVVDGTSVTNSDSDQLTVSAGSSATQGTYSFRTVRTASTHSAISKGFANTDTQLVGAGTLVLSSGGEVTTSTRLDLLNGGAGVRRGTIRLTDRDGNVADVDLSTAYDVTDVLDAINDQTNLNVTARAAGDKLELTDASTGGGTFSVVDLGSGAAAADLGIAKNTTGDTLTGDAVYALTEDFTLDLISDGNAIRRTQDAPDVRITLTDDTVIDVNLDAAASLADVIAAINDHEDNGGKVSAALVGGALQLTDTSGGGGSSSFTIADLNNANVVEALGLDTAESGGVIGGRRLLAGLNSVLLDNLNGGSGITTSGSISITDRAGNNASIDLSAAGSLDEVLDAINADGTIQVVASVNDTGTGILLTDVSGGSSDLIVADVASGTTATDLGIAGTFSADSVDSGSLGRRYVNEATNVDALLPAGTTLGTGDIRITDSAGNTATVTLSGAVDTIGDVIDRINAASGISVTAALNDTGDGLVVIDEAGGVDTLTIEDAIGTVGAKLGLNSTVYTGGDSKQRISGRVGTTTIEITAEDTLTTLVEKINDAGGYASASIVNTGSAINPYRIQFDATRTGAGGRFHVQSDGGLLLETFASGEDALLRVGSDFSTGFLIASSTNQFEDVVGGIDVTVKQPGQTAAVVGISRDVGKLKTALEKFVTTYNAFVDDVDAKTEFNLKTNKRGVLNGETTTLRVATRLESLANRRLSGFAGATVASLNDLGIRVSTGGKLTFDTDVFDDLMVTEPSAVTEFLLREDTGFAAVAKSTFEALTDPLTGTFELADSSLQTSVDALDSRITDLEEILAARFTRTFNQFVRMEQTLALLQSQQETLSVIQPLSAPQPKSS